MEMAPRTKNGICVVSSYVFLAAHICIKRKVVYFSSGPLPLLCVGELCYVVDQACECL